MYMYTYIYILMIASRPSLPETRPSHFFIFLRGAGPQQDEIPGQLSLIYIYIYIYIYIMSIYAYISIYRHTG